MGAAWAAIVAAAACSTYGVDGPPTTERDASTTTEPNEGDGSAAPPGCELPWGGTLAHGESVKAYTKGATSYSEGPCTSETRLCFNGMLSGANGFETCVAEPETTPLADSTKTIADCLGAGGQLAQADSKYICKRATSSCWSGWSRYQRWSTTTASSCSGSCASPKSCTTVAHGWANESAETCSYTSAGTKAIYCNSETCTAKTVAVGCN